MNIEICKKCQQGEFRIIMNDDNNPKLIACTPYNKFRNVFMCDLTRDVYNYVLNNTSIKKTHITPHLIIKFLKFDKKIKKHHPILINKDVEMTCPYYMEHQMSSWNKNEY